MEKRRLLIVDDDLIMREILGSYFRKLAYECVCAPDSTTALALLQSSEFDLLICDMMMPGNEDLALIRQVPSVAPGLPVLLLTAHPTLESAVQSVRLPVVAYLVKPPNLDDLQTLVRQSIDQYRTYQTVNANRQHLQNWLLDLTQLEEALGRSPDEAPSAPVNDCLTLTFRNVLQSLTDMKQMIQAVAREDDTEQALSRISLIEALRKTIDVLASTRQSFRSRELAELRRSLEELLRDQGGQAQGPGNFRARWG